MAWLDVNDVAAHMKVHPRTVQRWCRERSVPHVRKGRTIRFTQSQLAEIEAAYTREPVESVAIDVPNPEYQERCVVVPMKRPA